MGLLVGVRIIDRGYGEAIRALASLRGAEVQVGVMGDEDLVKIATINEFGSNDGHVPARPFLRVAIDANRETIDNEVLKQTRLVAYNRRTIPQALAEVGVVIKGKIVNQINSNMGPANAPSTVAKKGSSRTLVDTGELRDSISFQVRTPRAK
jgi:phage gpG-like protein